MGGRDLCGVGDAQWVGEEGREVEVWQTCERAVDACVNVCDVRGHILAAVLICRIKFHNVQYRTHISSRDAHNNKNTEKVIYALFISPDCVSVISLPLRSLRFVIITFSFTSAPQP